MQWSARGGGRDGGQRFLGRHAGSGGVGAVVNAGGVLMCFFLFLSVVGRESGIGALGTCVVDAGRVLMRV